MKKFLCIFMCILMLSGCGIINKKDVEKEPLVISGFNTCVSTVINDVTVKANVQYERDTGTIFDFLSPESAVGTKIVCKDGEYSVTYKDLSFTLAGDKMPTNMVCRAMDMIISNCEGVTPVLKGEALIYTFVVNESQFILYTDAEKRFQKLTKNGNELLLFENFQYTVK